MRQLYLLSALLSLLAVACAKCGTHTDCASCSAAKEGLINCMWCASDNACHSQANTDCHNAYKIIRPFDCPVAPSNGQQYNETFARKVVMPLIGATEGRTNSQVQTCLNKLPGTLLYKSYEFECDKDGDNCFGYLAVNEKLGAIVLAIRGSVGAKQMLEEGLDYLTKAKVKFPGGGKVDHYFYHAFDVLFSGGMEHDLQGLILKYPTFEGWFVGHSLGGSAVSIAAAYSAYKKYFTKEKIRLVTFGQPRTGDIAFAEAHDGLVKYHHRLVHHHDLVPHIPPRNFDDLFDSPFHHRYEVWYDNDMSAGSPFKMCTRADDHACANSLPLTSLKPTDHTYYFGVAMFDWYLTGCQ